MTFRGPVCDAPGCARAATCHIGRKVKLCDLHADMTRIGVKTAAKSAAVAAAPALTRRFPKLVTAAKLFVEARAKYNDLRERADRPEKAEVIEATVIHTKRSTS